jgi:hypothetical protein
MSNLTESSTNLNIRIDKVLKRKLDDFAKLNGATTSALVISQIQSLLLTKHVDPGIVRLSSKEDRLKIKRYIDTHL